MGTAISLIQGNTGNNADVSKAVSSAKGNSDFGKIMSKTIAGNVNSGIMAQNGSKSMSNSNVSASDKKTNISRTDKDSNASGAYKASDNVKQDDSKTSNAAQKTEDSAKAASDSGKSNNSQKVDNTTDNTSDELKDQIASAIDELKSKIKSELGVTDEQIDQALQALGLSMQDLLNSQNLADVLTNLSGVESTMDILTNGQLSDSFNEIMNFLDAKMEELSVNTGMSHEQLKAAIADTKVQENALVQQDNGGSSKTSEQKTEYTQVTETDEDVKQILLNKMSVTTEKNNSSDTNDGMLGGKGSNQSAMSQAEAGNGTTLSEVAGNLSGSIQGTFAQVMATTSTETISGAEVIKQVIEAVKVTGGKEIQSLEIQLNPQSLGKVNLTVTAKNGIVTAELIAQNEQVKKAMETQLSTLKENLQNQGIKVEAVEITVQSHAFESGQNLKGNDSSNEGQNKNSKKGLKLDSLDDLLEDDMSDEEIRAKNLLENENSSVEYSA